MSQGRIDTITVHEGGFITEVSVHCMDCNTDAKRLFYAGDVTLQCPDCRQRWVLNLEYMLKPVEDDG